MRITIRSIAFAAVFAAFVLAAPVAAQAQTDTQYRFLTHYQSDHWALWGALPNTNAPGPAKVLVVGGLVAHENKNWVEALVGELLRNPDGDHRVVNFRAYALDGESNLKTDGYAEAFYDLSARRLTLTANATMLIFERNGFKIRAGAESELVGQEGKATAIDMGPRLVVPFETGGDRKPSAIALTCRWRIDPRGGATVCRSYVALDLTRKPKQAPSAP